MNTKFFYKYRPIINDNQLQFVIEILNEYKFFLSNINYFSDPFDAFQKKSLLHKNKKILSLTEAKDCKLLWAYYGGWYSGVMIEFEINMQYNIFSNLKKINYINNIYETKYSNNYNLYLKPIEYSFEKEWRLVYEGKKNYIFFPKYFIKSITLGPSLQSNYEKYLIQVCRKNKIKIQKYMYCNNIPIINREKSKKLILNDNNTY